jgi:hypothetical protein
MLMLYCTASRKTRVEPVPCIATWAHLRHVRLLSIVWGLSKVRHANSPCINRCQRPACHRISPHLRHLISSIIQYILYVQCTHVGSLLRATGGMSANPSIQPHSTPNGPGSLLPAGTKFHYFNLRQQSDEAQRRCGPSTSTVPFLVLKFRVCSPHPSFPRRSCLFTRWRRGIINKP